MKKLIFIISVILTIYSSSFAQNDWEWIAPYPPYKIVYSSVQTENKIYFWCEDNTVIKLDVDNEKFEVLPTYAPRENVALGDFTEQGLAFADSLNGYVADVAYGEFRTTNGGQSWIRTANPGSNIHLVTFGSKVRGWKLGIGGFYLTNNAGLTWTYLGAPFFGGYGYLSKLYAINENQIWVLKSFHYSGFEGSMWYSSNGGNNWSLINTGLVSDSLNQVTYTDMLINTSGIGIAIGFIIHPDDNTLEGFIQRTTDTGMTWSTSTFENERFKNVLSINNNDWVVLGNSGYYNDSRVVQRFSSNMGISWSQSFPLQSLFEHTTFYNAIYSKQNDAIYMFATFGVYKSLDNGNSYTKMSSDHDVRINNIVFDSKPDDPNNQIGIAWLKWNISPYLISFDGGHSWQQKSLPQSMGYIWSVGIAEDVIYIITDQTRLFKSTDYGENWSSLNVPIYSGLQAFRVYNKDIFVLYAYKNLVSSTDGGNSWITGPVINNFGLRESEIISPGKIIGVGHYSDSLGTRGSFFKTSDYGYSWHIADIDEELYEVQMTNDWTGFALGDNKVYKTSDSGESWNIKLSQSSYYRIYSSLTFTDSLNGVVIERYNFRKTNNGGNTWTTEPMWVPLSGIDKLEYNAKGDLFAIGNGILLISHSLKSQQPEVKNDLKELTDHYLLDQNYPNPFNPITTIKYEIPEKSFITIKVYDILGKEIATLANEEKPVGNYEAEFDGSNLSSGIYFYRLQAGSFIETKKMILIK